MKSLPRIKYYDSALSTGHVLEPKLFRYQFVLLDLAVRLFVFLRRKSL